MELSNSFTVEVGPDRAWEVLTDVPAIAPCLPGAQLQEVDGEEYKGIVKVKVGPIVAQYRGAATFVEKDAEARRIVLRAEGRETRGQGNASATITAQLEPAGDGTHVTVTTDLTVTGKVAQFGRGVLADVSAKLLGQFVDNLEQTVLTDDALAAAEVVGEAEAALVASTAAEGNGSGPAEAPAGTAAPTGGAEEIDLTEADVEAATEEPSAVRKVDMPEPEAIDLLGSAGSPVLKRAVPLLGVAIVAFVLWRLLRRRG